MKILTLWLVASLALLVPASAGYNEKHLESVKKSAAEKGKLIIFSFAQGYYAPNCPKCIVNVNANNKAMQNAFPRRYATIITIPANTDKHDLEKLPASVKAARKGEPQLIATDASCDKVIGSLEGRPDRKQAGDFEKVVAAASVTK